MPCRKVSYAPGSRGNRSLQEPSFRRGIRLEELQQQLTTLFLARRRLMRAVVTGEVALLVAEAVRPLGAAVGPQVRAPAQPRCLHLTLVRIVVQRGFALELLLDQPF